MKTLTITIALGALVLARDARAAEQKAKGAAKPHAMSINPDQLQWGDAPPSLPKGAQVAVLHGDPSKAGPFVIRLKMPAGYKIAPHWHSQAENLTIVSGALKLHRGDTMDAPADTLSPGGFHFLPGKAHHAAEAEEETVVQVHGNGPFDIHYLNPADDPAKAASAK
jgi:quercetin dioxygenase-like cupin family protein